MCAVSGIILNEYSVEVKNKISLFPVMIFLFSGICALLIKIPILKLLVPLLISLLVFLNKNEKYNFY